MSSSVSSCTTSQQDTNAVTTNMDSPEEVPVTPPRLEEPNEQIWPETPGPPKVQSYPRGENGSVGDLEYNDSVVGEELEVEEVLPLIEDEDINCEAINNYSTLLKKSLGNKGANKFLQLQYEAIKQMVKGIQKSEPEDKPYPTHQLIQGELLAINEQLRFKNLILENKVRAWELWREEMLMARKIPIPKPKPARLQFDTETARIEWKIINSIPSTLDVAYYQLKSPRMELFSKSLQDLCSNNWLYDVVLNTFSTILSHEICRLHGESYAITMSSQWTKYIYTTNEEEPDLLPILAQTGYSITKTKYIFFPMHMEDLHHWILVWIDIENKLVTIYNTMEACDVHFEVCGANIIQLLELFHNTLSKTEFDDQNWTTQYNTNCKQLDSNNCGVDYIKAVANVAADAFATACADVGADVAADAGPDAAAEAAADAVAGADASAETKSKPKRFKILQYIDTTAKIKSTPTGEQILYQIDTYQAANISPTQRQPGRQYSESSAGSSRGSSAGKWRSSETSPLFNRGFSPPLSGELSPLCRGELSAQLNSQKGSVRGMSQWR
ncbi:hypothetical protein DFP73DRAFT_601923 [Morchella snyderi]|nr:hypothetical protein DFP73DRAFT_601923 [Morchella snyderi]